MPTAIIIATMLALTAKAQVDWDNPAVLGINKLPYHATLQLPSRERECKEIVSLDGQWAFYWSPRPEACPADFWREDFDVSAWNSITVPGNWQTQGFGTPIYININYPFVRNRPSVTTEPPRDWTAYENRNPVGSYVRFFDVTKATRVVSARTSRRCTIRCANSTRRDRPSTTATAAHFAERTALWKDAAKNRTVHSYRTEINEEWLNIVFDMSLGHGGRNIDPDLGQVPVPMTHGSSSSKCKCTGPPTLCNVYFSTRPRSMWAS